LRRAINKYVEQNFNVSYAPENEVIITVGVSEGSISPAARSSIPATR